MDMRTNDSSEWIYHDLPQDVIDASDASTTELDLIIGGYDALEDPADDRPLTARELIAGELSPRKLCLGQVHRTGISESSHRRRRRREDDPRLATCRIRSVR